MRQVEFDRQANGFADRYGTFLNSLKSAYQSRILNRQINYKGFKSFDKEANAIGSLYLDNENVAVHDAQEAISQYLRSDFAKDQIDDLISNDEQAQDYLSNYSAFLFNSIKQQVSKDINSLGQKLRVDALKLVTNNYDYVGLIHSYKDPNFYYNDAIGRSLPSRKYVRTTARDYFVKIHADLTMLNAKNNNYDEVVVSHLDQNHKDNNLVLSVNDTQNDLHYYNVRDNIFHPNSNAILGV